jgi:hypothetical protein
MKIIKLFIILFFAFTITNSMAQTNHSEKIVGCWTFKKVAFNGKYEFEDEIIRQTENTVVCFTPDGKFITKNTEQEAVITNGTYKISDDGKTLYQKQDLTDGSEDVDAHIELLDDKNLQFKLEFGIMYFERI